MSNIDELARRIRLLENQQQFLGAGLGVEDPAENAVAKAVSLLMSFPGIAAIWTTGTTDASGRLIDVSGNGLHMTANNAPKFGLLTNGMPFVRYAAASSQYHSLASATGSTTDINGNEAYIRDDSLGLTITCIVQFVTAPASSMHIMSKSIAGGNAWLLSKDASGNIQFSIFNSSTIYSVTSSVTITNLEFYVISARFQPSTGLYLRVNNDEQSNTTSIPATIDSTAAAVTIGARSTPEAYFDGTFSLGSLGVYVGSPKIAAYHNTVSPAFAITN